MPAVGQNTALLQPSTGRTSPTNAGGMTTLNTEAASFYVHPGRATPASYTAAELGNPRTSAWFAQQAVPRLPLGGTAADGAPQLPRGAGGEAEVSFDAEVAGVNTGGTPRHTIVGPTAFIPTPSPSRMFVEGTGQVAGTKTTPRSWSSKLKLVQTPAEYAVGRLLRDAAKSGKTDACAQLLADGAAPDAVDERYCNTPLLWAAMRGFHTTVELLLAKGAQADAPNADGWTALVAAVWYGHVDTCRVLLENGASLTVLIFNIWSSFFCILTDQMM